MGSTNLNERSSRSHAVITINIDSQVAGSNHVRRGKLHLVDLAGSEALTSGLESKLTAETRAINVSLTALCDVLQALSKNARRPRGAAPLPVPYRNHRLTRLLADSLGGSSHTLMIAAVQTAGTHYRSTLTTLKYAARARDITNHAALNASSSGLDGLAVGELRQRVAELEGRLARREAELERLEALHKAKEGLDKDEHERRLAAAAEGAAAELEGQLLDAKATALRDAAEHAYAAAALEAQIVALQASHREALLACHVAEDGVASFQRRAEDAEARLRLAEAQRDESIEQSHRGALALERASAAWEAERTALVSAAPRRRRRRRRRRRARPRARWSACAPTSPRWASTGAARRSSSGGSSVSSSRASRASTPPAARPWAAARPSARATRRRRRTRAASAPCSITRGSAAAKRARSSLAPGAAAVPPLPKPPAAAAPAPGRRRPRRPRRRRRRR